MNSKRFSRAFTLIELLMCIAIVAILGAILYVTFAPARAKAVEVNCVNNLRQIGVAMQMYRQDYGGSDSPQGTTAAEYGLPPNIALQFALKPYITNTEVYRCPVAEAFAISQGRQIGKYTTFYHNLMNRGEEKDHGFLSFEQNLQQYREQTPILADRMHSKHGLQAMEKINWNEKSKTILLMMDGSIITTYTTNDDFNRSKWNIGTPQNGKEGN